MKGISIKIKIFAHMVIFLLGSIILLAALSFNMSKNSLRQTSLDKLVLLTESKKETIEQQYDLYYENFSNISMLPSLEQFVISASQVIETNEYMFQDTVATLVSRHMGFMEKCIKKLGFASITIIHSNTDKVIFSTNDIVSMPIDFLPVEYKNLVDAYKHFSLGGDATFFDFDLHDSISTNSYLAGTYSTSISTDVAVILLEIPSNQLETMVVDYTNLKETGEFIIYSQDSALKNHLRFRPDTLKDFVMPVAGMDLKKETHAPTTSRDYRGKNIYYYSRKLQIPGLGWTLLTKMDKKEILSASFGLQSKLLAISFILSILVVFMSIIFLKDFSNPLNYVIEMLKKLSKGQISADKKLFKRRDELGIIIRNVHKLLDYLQTSADYSIEIGKGNFNAEYKVKSHDDVLGKSLIELKNNLMQAKKQDEERREEDEHRGWTSNGLAKFSNILRQNTKDLKELTYIVIEQLVSYIGANQGGIFVINADEPDDVHLELQGAYAYDRRKYLQKRVNPGEGYIGACMLEKEKTYLTEIPDDYSEIITALGHEKPKCVLITPLIHNEELVGVMELASFKILEPYEVDFIVELSESIANTILAVRTNMQTERLLNETKEQAEKMRMQEEEMRQNMEEMSATQEQLAKQKEESQQVIDMFYNNFYVAEYDPSGKIRKVNQSYLNLLNMEMIHLANHLFSDNIEYVNKFTEDNGEKRLWKSLQNGKTIHVESKLKVMYNMVQQVFLMKEVYVPVIENDNLVKVIKIATEIGDMDD